MAEHGHFGGNVGETRQGIYVCAPSGKFLGSTNSLNPKRVLQMLNRAWDNWEELPPDQRKLQASAEILPAHRWEDSYPTDGLVLSMFVRDIPDQCDPTEESRVKWNRDFVWFSADEARSWLPPEPQTGMTHTLPDNLAHRLSRFHLVDVARGQTRPLKKSQVATSKMTTRVTALDGPIVQLEIRGETTGDVVVNPNGQKDDFESSRRRYRQRETDHGVQTRLLGHAKFNLDSGRFEAMEFVALGARWGRTRFNGRHRDPRSASPVGYVFQLTTKNTPHVAPGFIAYYDAPWLTRPTQPPKKEFTSE